MKKVYLSLLFAGLFTVLLQAQNTFPSSGNVGIGTNSPSASLQVKGTARLGGVANYLAVDTSGYLSFAGGGAYKVAGNKYVFRYASRLNYGLFFNSTNFRYEFKDSLARSLFYINANDGGAVFSGNALPAANNTRDLGSSTANWRNIYMGGNLYNGSSVALSFRLSGVALGRGALASNVSGLNNIAIGINALNKNQSASNLIAIGDSALYSNTTGIENVAVGFKSLALNTNGFGNTSIGFLSMYNNISGYSNTSIGYHAMLYNTTGTANVASGHGVLGFNASGSENTGNGYFALAYNNGWWNSAYGSRAMFNNSTGNDNVAVGHAALFSNTLQSNTVAVGDSSLFKNGTGAAAGTTQATGNTAVGSKALFNNTTGYANTSVGYQSMQSNTDGGYNVAVGYQAFQKNITGTSNIAVGYQAMQSNTSGHNNVVAGVWAQYSNTTGINNVSIGKYANYYSTVSGGNTAIGAHAGDYTSNGDNNTFIGYLASTAAAGYSNSTAIGYNAIVNTSDEVRIGDNEVTSIGGIVNWTNISDGRYKKNIKENVPGLVFINSLKPVTYNLDITGINRVMQRNRTVERDKEDGMKKVSEAEAGATAKKEAILYSGFVAQEVEKSAKEAGYNFSGVDAPKNDNDLYGLRYSEFVVPLVKAVQELSAKVEQLQQEVAALKNGNNGNISTNASSQSVLGQNVPNPVDRNTVIPFKIARNSKDASLVITQTGSGKVIKSIVLNPAKTSVTVDAGMLATGAYIYTLYVDGKIAGSKQMLLAR